MKCPRCEADRPRIIDSRPRNSTTWRRRECRKCGYKWNTIEVPEFSRQIGMDEIGKRG